MTNILITGSEGQIGQIFVKKLLSLGHNVFGMDKVNKINDGIIYYTVDLTKKKEIVKALEKIPNDIEILINNAGTSVFTPFEERSEEELDQVINLNLKSNIIITQLIFNKYLKKINKGCIVNIGSIYGVVAGDMKIYNKNDRKTSEVYGATKSAIINLTKYFACYMAKYNIRVNCISPGGVYNNHSENFVKNYSNKVPLNRMCKEEELTSTLEYLISPDSGCVTGQNIIVDGGLTAL